MAYSKKLRLSSAKGIMLIATCLIGILVAFYQGYLLYGSMATSKNEAAAKEGVAANGAATVTLVRAKHELLQGELLEQDKVELVEVPQELAPEDALTSLSLLTGMRLNRRLSARELIKESDLLPEAAAYNADDRLIEHNFAEGAVPAEVREGSAIDIKLFLEGQRDCVVISKAVVISRKANLLSFHMNTEEQEYLKEAAASGRLFAVLYIDPSQPPSEVTYVPSYDKGR
jgi:hypothetical protein